MSRSELRSLLAAKEIVIVCGSGGVGKTTTAAAMAATAAVELGGRVLVLTIDPARRLADAMGLAEIGHAEARVAIDDVRVGPARRKRSKGGELWAAMLDTKASWDDLIRRHAPDPATRDAVLANPLYNNLTSRFVHSHDYVAMERVHELHASGRYDLIVVDTPPSRNALDFLDAPARMGEFFGGQLLRWLTVPYRSKLFTAATKPFYSLADRVLGSRFLQDIAEFFILFQTMEKGFVQRAAEVATILSDRRTTFCVVTTLETAPLAEARFLIDELAARRFPLGAVIANKLLPSALLDAPTFDAAARLCEPAAIDRLTADLGADRGLVAAVATEIVARFDALSLVATRQSEFLLELAHHAGVVGTVPLLDGEIHDLSGLLALGAHLGIASA